MGALGGKIASENNQPVVVVQPAKESETEE
jgi:hypothetical protein